MKAGNRRTSRGDLEKRFVGRTGTSPPSKLGVEGDGDFGPNTEKALKDWQSKNGLAADGIAGPDTFMALGLHELVLLKQGTRGDAVKKLQENLGVGTDGKFGSGTEKAVRDYQQKNALVVDGLAGPATLAHMKLFKEIGADAVKASQVPASSAQPGGSGAAKPPVAHAGNGLRSIWDTIKGAFK